MTYWIKRMDKANEVTRDELSSLVDQLVKGMLAIGAWFAPIDWAGLTVNVYPVKFYALAIALHRQLLEISRKAL